MINVFDKLIHLEKEAAEFGFKWERFEQIKAQIFSEIAEVEIHIHDHDNEKLQEEIGDLLHAVFSLCIFCGFNPEATLKQSLLKFEKRFNTVKQLAAREGLISLNGKNFNELMIFWQKAKDNQNHCA